ncbi:MAG: hypothetical protein IAF38_16865, partial [Bacteroidia bacterium]|nr:hypothetical protein [Bacteroidia bacterium]
MKKTILFALFALSITFGLAQTFVAPNIEWVNDLAEKDSRESVPSAVDQNGNIYTVGFVTQGGNRNSV